MESIRPILPRVLLGYAGTAPNHTEMRPCACGGVVRADVRFPADGVRFHQRTKRHRAWRAANGLGE